MTEGDEVTVSIMVDYNQFYLVDTESGEADPGDEVERAPCLNLEDDSRAELLRAYGRETRHIELPPGWGRIVRRRSDTGELAGEVERVDDDPAFVYQRWRDDQPVPTQ